MRPRTRVEVTPGGCNGNYNKAVFHSCPRHAGHPRGHNREVVPAGRGRLLRNRRHRRADHCGQICVAGVSRLNLVFHLWPDEAPACQRHALRLAAGGRHGSRLLPGSAALRRQAVEREARRCDLDPLEHHHPQRDCYAAGRVPEGTGIRRPSHPGRGARGDCLGHVRNQHLHDHRHTASTSRCMSPRGT